MGNWTITVPEATTNLWTNPSIEQDTTGFSASGSGTPPTISRDATFARFGTYSLKIVCIGDGANQGVSTPAGASGIAATVGTSYTTTVYAKGSGTIYLRHRWYNGAAIVSTDSGTGVALSATSWQRLTITSTAPATTTNLTALIGTTTAQAVTYYVDGLQVEAKAYATTYIDGDQPGGTWAGLRHGSTSSRAANYRLGGREYDIQTQYGLRVRQFSGAGVADYELMTQELALQPGAVFLRDKISARNLTLTLDNNSTSAAGLHSKRKAFWNVIKPDALGQSQPFLIGYSGAASGKTVYGAFRYAGGWGLNDGMNGGANYIEASGTVGLRLLAVDPFWYADDAESAVLDYQDSLASNNFAIARIGGAWQNLGTGFNAAVNAIAVDKERGRVYFAGAFTTANGVTVNGVTYWNGSTFVAMGGTAGVAGGIAYALAVAPNGDVYVGGAFTSAGGSTADGLARWNVAAGTWTAFTNGTPGDVIRAIAINNSGTVYIGGTFVNWDGNASSDYIVSYNGTAFAPLSTGTNGAVHALAIGLNGTTLYVGGDFTTPQTRIMSWNGSAFSAMGSGASSIVRVILCAPDGSVYVGGDFTTTPSTSNVARWNGVAWFTLNYPGVGSAVYSMALLTDNQLIVSGNMDDVYVYSGNTWYLYDSFLLSSPGTFTSIAVYNGVIYIGHTIASTTLISGRTTVTVLSTAPVYPIITITGPTTAASTCTLQWLENQTTGERLYFNLSINTGEIITIDLRPQARKVSSNWRGQIFDQPLPTSDYSSWHLVTGANTVAAFMTGTITGATMVMNWAKIHASIDGEAA